MDDAVPFHFGFAVRDLDRATRQHSALGVSRWVFTDWHRTRYFDARAGGLIEPRYRVAYGRLTDDLALEFLITDPDSAVPMPWEVSGAGLGTGHIGHWTRDTGPVARRLLREGGRIVFARAASPAVEALTPEAAADPDGVPEGLDACYVLTAGGQLVELLPARVWAGRLVDTFGPDTPRVIPRPPAHLV